MKYTRMYWLLGLLLLPSCLWFDPSSVFIDINFGLMSPQQRANVRFVSVFFCSEGVNGSCAFASDFDDGSAIIEVEGVEENESLGILKDKFNEAIEIAIIASDQPFNSMEEVRDFAEDNPGAGQQLQNMMFSQTGNIDFTIFRGLFFILAPGAPAEARSLSLGATLNSSGFPTIGCGGFSPSQYTVLACNSPERFYVFWCELDVNTGIDNLLVTNLGADGTFADNAQAFALFPTEEFVLHDIAIAASPTCDKISASIIRSQLKSIVPNTNNPVFEDHVESFRLVEDENTHFLSIDPTTAVVHDFDDNTYGLGLDMSFVGNNFLVTWSEDDDDETPVDPTAGPGLNENFYRIAGFAEKAAWQLVSPEQSLVGASTSIAVDTDTNGTVAQPFLAPVVDTPLGASKFVLRTKRLPGEELPRVLSLQDNTATNDTIVTIANAQNVIVKHALLSLEEDQPRLLAVWAECSKTIGGTCTIKGRLMDSQGNGDPRTFTAGGDICSPSGKGRGCFTIAKEQLNVNSIQTVAGANSSFVVLWGAQVSAENPNASALRLTHYGAEGLLRHPVHGFFADGAIKPFTELDENQLRPRVAKTQAGSLLIVWESMHTTMNSSTNQPNLVEDVKLDGVLFPGLLAE